VTARINQDEEEGRVGGSELHDGGGGGDGDDDDDVNSSSCGGSEC